MSNESLWVRLRDYVKGYFDLSSYLDDEKMAEEAVMDGVSFKGANIIILILAIFIASLAQAIALLLAASLFSSHAVRKSAVTVRNNKNIFFIIVLPFPPPINAHL